MRKDPLLLLLALCLVSCTATKVFNNLQVTWGLLNGYNELPTTQTDAIKAGFVFMIHDAYLKCDLYSYQGDPKLAILFDQYGNIGGLRIGYIQSDVVQKAKKNNITFPTTYYSNKKMYVDTIYWGVNVWYNTVLFVNPKTLKAGGRNVTNGIVAEDLYVKLFGTWTQMPRTVAGAVSLNFTKQGCFPGIGTHYFHEMTESANCDDLQGIYLTYNSVSELIGMGLAPWGSYTAGPNVTWFETVTAVETEFMVPRRPDCLTEYVNNYGLSSLHIFLTPFPRWTLCPC